jgi:hypothetical protein
MKFFAPRSILASLAFASAFAALPALAQDAVLNPNKRAESLAAGKSALTAKANATGIKDPFHSTTFVEALGGAVAPTPTGQTQPEVRVVAGPRSNRDLLQSIAASLKPSGFFVLGGEPTLVFGQKRVKAGGSLTIRFEEKDYVLEVVSIERPNFTLRLNGEEFTRPIK